MQHFKRLNWKTNKTANTHKNPKWYSSFLPLCVSIPTNKTLRLQKLNSVVIYLCNQNGKTRAKDVFQNINHTQATKTTATEWSRLLLLDVICSVRVSFHHCRGWWECIACFLSLVTLTFDLWSWHSNSSEREIKHIFHVNLMQIHSAVPETFHTQTKKTNKTGAKMFYQT